MALVPLVAALSGRAEFGIMKLKPFIEPLVAWGMIVAVARLSEEISLPVIQRNASLITAVFLLYVPLLLFLKRRDRVGFVDRSWEMLGRGIAVALTASLVIFPLAALVNHFYQGFLGNGYEAAPFRDFWNFALGQLVLVAFPEEFFFRGYFQEKLQGLFVRRWRLFGISAGPGFFLCAALFALSHSLVTFQWWHALIFFPALVFGWLRERTGTITAPILFHFLCNLFSRWVALHYF